MDPSALRREADRLARPCVYLRASGHEYAAIAFVEGMALPLLAWTFEGAEPWLEAWARDGALRAIQRIT